MSIFRTLSSEGRFTVSTYGGRTCLIWHRQANAQRAPNFPADVVAFRLLCTHLASTGEYHLVQDRVKSRGRPPRRNPTEILCDILDEVTFLEIHGPDPTQVPGEAAELDPPECFYYMGLPEPHTRSARGTADALAACARLAFPAVAGSVNHPVHGDPEGVWLRPLERPDPGSVSLLDALDKFDLSPEGRTTLGVYLCGLFHACSLTQPRPALFVDSWVRGVGKSTLCAMVSSLVDGKPTNLGLTAGVRAEDAIAAHITSGHRCLVCANLDGLKDFQNEDLVCLATDGGRSFRRKYEADTTPVNGVAVMLNAVYGAASLHYDLVARIWRVELQGRKVPAGMVETSDLFARKHRDSIIGSILAAHDVAERVQAGNRVHDTPVSRFHAFELAGRRAWHALTSEPSVEIAERLSAMHLGRAAYLTESVASLNAAHKTAIDRINPDFATQGVAKPPEGSTAVGFTYTNGEWK